MVLGKSSARRSIKRARSVVQPRGMLAMGQTGFVQSRRHVLRGTKRQAKLQEKFARTEEKLTRRNQKLQNAETGLWGTRAIRLWWNERKRNKLWKKKQRLLGKIQHAHEKTGQAKTRYGQRFDARHAVFESKKARPVARMNYRLNRLSAKIPTLANESTQIVDRLQQLNLTNPAANQVDNALFASLRTKIATESAGTDRATAVFRLLEIENGLKTVQRRIKKGQKALAETEINRLVALATNPPA